MSAHSHTHTHTDTGGGWLRTVPGQVWVPTDPVPLCSGTIYVPCSEEGKEKKGGREGKEGRDIQIEVEVRQTPTSAPSQC